MIEGGAAVALVPQPDAPVERLVVTQGRERNVGRGKEAIVRRVVEGFLLVFPRTQDIGEVGVARHFHLVAVHGPGVGHVPGEHGEGFVREGSGQGHVEGIRRVEAVRRVGEVGDVVRSRPGHDIAHVAVLVEHHHGEAHRPVPPRIPTAERGIGEEDLEGIRGRVELHITTTQTVDVLGHPPTRPCIRPEHRRVDGPIPVQVKFNGILGPRPLGEGNGPPLRIALCPGTHAVVGIDVDDVSQSGAVGGIGHQVDDPAQLGVAVVTILHHPQAVQVKGATAVPVVLQHPIPARRVRVQRVGGRVVERVARAQRVGDAEHARLAPRTQGIFHPHTPPVRPIGQLRRPVLAGHEMGKGRGHVVQKVGKVGGETDLNTILARAAHWRPPQHRRVYHPGGVVIRIEEGDGVRRGRAGRIFGKASLPHCGVPQLPVADVRGHAPVVGSPVLEVHEGLVVGGRCGKGGRFHAEIGRGEEGRVVDLEHVMSGHRVGLSDGWLLVGRIPHEEGGRHFSPPVHGGERLVRRVVVGRVQEQGGHLGGEGERVGRAPWACIVAGIERAHPPVECLGEFDGAADILRVRGEEGLLVHAHRRGKCRRFVDLDLVLIRARDRCPTEEGMGCAGPIVHGR